MKKNAAVIGYPIMHSKSPLIHNKWLSAHNIDGEYHAVEIDPPLFDGRISALAADDNLCGFNVTLPYKQQIMAKCTNLDDAAKAIGAVNTVFKDKNGALNGANTDAYGFWANIKSAYPDFDLRGQKIVVLGAGGAARAVVYALKQQGAGQIIITNRTFEKAKSLAAEFGTDHCEWEKRAQALSDCALLVNTTSLGMKAMPDLDIDLSLLPIEAIINDIVYAPLMTDLLQAGEKRGNKVVTGIGMLLYQAQKAFEIWHGVLPDIDDDLIKEVLA